ncbi:MAG: hypothetical protein WBG01_04230 [Bacteroidota bacterium]
MSFIKILLFVAMGFILWRIIRVTMRLLGGRERPNIEDLRDKYRQRKPEQKFRDVKEADFEDITPKEKKEGPPRS